jgi:uncharacterized protein YegP (UPF0339 family)
LTNLFFGINFVTLFLDANKCICNFKKIIKMGKYQIRRTSNGQFRWTLKASNGETLITSETYVSKQGCLDGVASSKVCVADKNFDKKTSTSGQPYFNQVANNYQVLGTSEMYSSTSARDNGIDSVKRNAPTATIEDLT